jgi:aminoglycoside phosphotransferase (APT) family kinase protein
MTKLEVKCFPVSLARTVKAKPPPTSSSKGFPLIHWDFLLHNVLLDDQFNIVGLPDWENTYSAPFEVFVAHTNMYSHFDSKTLRMVPDGVNSVSI